MLSKNNDRWDKCRVELALLILAALIVVLLNIFRLSYNLIWVDEGFSILAATSPSFDSLLEKVAEDRIASPFFYNVSLYLFTALFGHNVFVYQLFSFIPLVLMLVVSITHVRKEFGFYVTITFMILCSFLFTSIVYMFEIRTYEWAAFFVMVSFLYLYKILNEPSKKNYAIFLIFSLLSAYSHYYACMAIGLVYMSLFVYSMVLNKGERKNVVITSVLFAVCYAPWMMYCVLGMINWVGNMWINFIPTLGDCLTILFANKFGLILCIVMLMCFALIIRDNVELNVQSKMIKISPVGVWLIIGATAVFGSIALAQIVCRFVHPVMTLRYLYPASVIAWFLFSYCVCNWIKDIKIRKIWSIAVIVLLLLITVPQSVQINTLENGWNNEVQSSIETMRCISNDDIVLTDEYWVTNSYFQTYFPDVTLIHFSRSDVPTLEEDRHYYVMINGLMSQTTVEEQLLEQGYGVKTVKEYMLLGAGYRHQAEVGDLLTQYYALYEIYPII